MDISAKLFKYILTGLLIGNRIETFLGQFGGLKLPLVQRWHSLGGLIT